MDVLLKKHNDIWIKVSNIIKKIDSETVCKFQVSGIILMSFRHGDNLKFGTYAPTHVKFQKI